jgi:hypothetical protein
MPCVPLGCSRLQATTQVLRVHPLESLNPRFILLTGPLTIGGSSAPRCRSYRGLDQVNLMDQAPQSLIVDAVGRTQAIKLRALRAQAR